MYWYEPIIWLWQLVVASCHRPQIIVPLLGAIWADGTPEGFKQKEKTN